jgi:hypothetical protein
MTRSLRLLCALGSAVLAAGAAACADTGSSNIDTVPATISLSRTGIAALGEALLGDSGSPDSMRFGGARIRRGMIDSLVVNVSQVEVLPDSEIQRCHPPVGDSASGFRPGPHPEGPGGPGGGEGPMGPPPGGCGRPPHFEGGEHPPRPDSILPPDTGWGSHARNWYTLDVSGSGHLNLLALPTDTANGLVLASGTLPVGQYGAARLLITTAKIYFDTTWTSPNGFTFQANTAYDVTLPSRGAGTPQGIMTKAGFTLTAAGADVVLVFDPDATLGGAVVTGTGAIIIRPTLAPHHGGPGPR